MRLNPTTMIALFGALVFLGCGPVYVRSRGTVRAQATVRVAVPQRVVVQTAPPPLRPAVAVRPAAPATNAVWVDGHYKWEAGGWVWVPGHWERDRPGVVWVAPVAEQQGGTVVYRPGYWCPVDQAPDPSYARPGRVRVSVRPSDPAPARATGATVRVVDGRSGTAASGGRVSVRGSSGASGTTGGSVSVRGSAGTSGGTSASGGRVSTRGSTGASGTPGTSATGGRVTVRGAPAASASGGTVRGRGSVNRGDDSVATAAPRGTGVAVRGGSARTVEARGATAQQGTARTVQTRGATAQQGTARTVEARGATTQQGSARTVETRGTTAQQGSARVRPSGTQGTVQNPGTPTGSDRQIALSCSINTTRAPRQGIITVSGTQFSRSARVQIGGSYGVVVNREAQRIRVQVPGSSSGGLVRVIDGSRTASCGRLTIR